MECRFPQSMSGSFQETLCVVVESTIETCRKVSNLFEYYYYDFVLCHWLIVLTLQRGDRSMTGRPIGIFISQISNTIALV